MATNELRISELDGIPSSWTASQVKDFLTKTGLFAVANSNVDTYHVSANDLYSCFGIEAILSRLDKLESLEGGVASVWYVDTDDGNDEDDGKTSKMAFKTLAKAISSANAHAGSNLIIVNCLSDSTQNITLLPPNCVVLSDSYKLTINISETISSGSVVTKGDLIINAVTNSSTSYFRANHLSATISGIGDVYFEGSSVTLNSVSYNANVTSSRLILNGNVSGKVIANVSSFNPSFINNGFCSIVSNEVTINEDNAITIESGKVIVNLSYIYGNHIWALLNASNNSSASLVGFVGYSEGSVLKSVSSTGTNTIKLSYAGEFGNSVYDAIVKTQEEFESALADSNVKTIFVKGGLYLSGSPTINGSKDIYGDYSVSLGYNGVALSTSANLRFIVPISVSYDSTLSGLVYVTDINSSVYSLSVSNFYYERNKGVSLLGTYTQEFWHTSVPNASLNNRGVVKLSSDFSIDDDGTLNLADKSLAKRFVDGTYTSPSYFVGQGTLSENYGTSTLSCNNSGIITIGSNIDFLILTINISSSHNTSSELQWFESQVQIGYWNDSTFVVVKTLSKEHTNDSNSIDDSFSYVIDVSKITGNKLGIKYVSNYDINSSSYSVCLVQTGSSVGSIGGTSDHLVLANSTDSVPNTLEDKLDFGNGIEHEVIDYGSLGKKVRIYSDINVAVTIPVESFNFNSVENLGGIWKPPVSQIGQPSDAVLIPMRMSPRCIVKSIVFRLTQYQLSGTRTCPFNVVFYASDDPYAVSSSTPSFGSYHSDTLNSNGYHEVNTSTNLITVPSDKKYYWCVLNMAVQQDSDVVMLGTVATPYNGGSPRVSTNAYGIINNYYAASSSIVSAADLSTYAVNDGTSSVTTRYNVGGTYATISGTIIPYLGIELYK